jgi:glycine cleavage system transcriptional repressor
MTSPIRTAATIRLRTVTGSEQARRFALCGIGRDQPGIVARVAQTLLDHRANIEDSQATILRGHFTMVFVVALPPDASVEALDEDLSSAGRELGLEALMLSEIEDIEPSLEPQASHMVTVYGADHPGIVHAVTTALAERDVDITDLNTKLSGDVYVLMLEVAPPPEADLGELELALADVARGQGVELTVRPLDDEPL